jgi:undecaprenyl-diphosphatase
MNLKIFKKKYNDYVRDLTSLGNPVVLIFVTIFSIGFDEPFFKVLLGLIIIEVLCSFIKYTFPRKRPNQQKYANSVEKIDAGSFPSIHTARVLFVILMLFNTFSQPVKFVAIFLLFVVGTTRILLRKHFFTDLLGGLVIGGGIFYLISLI